MKTDEPRDDEILGRALSRAIETAEANETPYERSRIALRPLKRGTSFWRVAALAASIVVAGALGSTLLERPASDEPVGQQPTGSPGATNTQAATATATAGPTPSPTPRPTAVDHQVVYFARDGLPPVGVHVRGVGNQSNPVDRITSRLSAVTLNGDLAKFPDADAIPAGAYSAIRGQEQVNGQGVGAVRVDGDIATVDLSVKNDDWLIRGSAETLAAIQQLVYTATEEPGIRRVLFTQNGGTQMRIDQMVIDRPLAREDVFGYAPGSTESISGGDGNTGELPTLSTRWSVDEAAKGLARFTIQVGAAGATAALPLFRVDVFQNDESNKPEGGKWRLGVTVSDGVDQAATAIVDQSPLRAVGAYPSKGPGTSALYEIGLDDLRPWRVYTMSNPTRIVVDIGGVPQAVSESIAVYDPVAGDQKGHEFTITGASRTFEGTTAWRIRDRQQRIVASGFTTASLGTSAVWGTFAANVRVPPSVSENVTLEVFWGSPRDGSDLGLVQIPVTIR